LSDENCDDELLAIEAREIRGDDVIVELGEQLLLLAFIEGNLEKEIGLD
jgi:hypothetical protein